MITIETIGSMMFGVAVMWGVGGKGFDYLLAWGIKKPQLNKRKQTSEEEE